MKVSIIGAGLAGSECAYQLLKRGVAVDLYEMKPNKFSPAHHNSNFAELVCSNSLKSNELNTAGGMLKQELRSLDSLLIKCADACAVPAGGALAVDRDKFSQMVTDKLKTFDNLNIINDEVTSIPEGIVVIASGPLTSDNLAKHLSTLFGQDYLYFFDAIAPIVEGSSIDYNVAFVGDRYGKGNGDYVNCPMSKDEYLHFWNELVNGEIVKLKDFENSKVFEGCMPIEVLAKRGMDSMRFGPLRPVGLSNPHSSEKPYAVVQLRKENIMGDCYNLVGFQTNLTYSEQARIFKLIPGLKDAEFVRYGTMHKNTYINAPKLLNKNYQLLNNPNIFVAGQLSGVEGYIESISSGLLTALNVYQLLNNKPMIDFTTSTMVGALSNYLQSASPVNFQPMSANMGLIPTGNVKIKDKKQKNLILAQKSLEFINKIINDTSNFCN